ncbi:MAG: NfeD family protein, partial [Acetobacteraceae bacterium]|nr:NfeD family protein [Acetobacteraceae bacterium]
MEPGLIWILIGLLLLVAELALPGIMLFWTGLAALGNGIVLLLV